MAEVRRLTLDDIFAFEHVTDAQISPDGARVAFVVGREYAEGEHTMPASSIWIVPADGSAPAVRYTYGVHSDARPRLSPDGRALAFLSDREKADTPQLYVLSLDGGEAQRLTHAKGGVSDLLWSADGARIAFLAADADSDEEERRKKDRDDAIYVDHDYKFTRLWVVDAKGGEPRAITPPEYQVRGAAEYGDGWVVAVSPTPHENDLFLPWKLQLVREGQSAETLWQGRFPVMPLSGSADGRAVVWRHEGTDTSGAVDEIWTLRQGEEPRCVLRGYAGGSAWAGWMPDGRSLLVAGIDGTRTVLGRMDVQTGNVETLLAGRTMLEAALNDPWATVSRDGNRIACILESGTQPKEVYVFEPGGEPRQITSFNRYLHDVELGRTETVRWQAPDGLTIEGVLIYPADYQQGQRYPLIVDIHGGPTWQWLDRLMLGWHDWGQWLAAHGYAVLLPNPRGSYGRGPAFTHNNHRNWGTGDFPDYMSGVDAMIERGIADPDHLGVGGWSYGGFMTSWVIGHTDRFKAAVVGAGVTDLLSFQSADIPDWLPSQQMLAAPYDDLDVYLRCSPIVSAGNVKTPTLIVHGQSDERVPVGQGRELYVALRQRGIPTEMVVYPREPHGLREKHHHRDLLTRVVEWFDKWVK